MTMDIYIYIVLERFNGNIKEFSEIHKDNYLILSLIDLALENLTTNLHLIHDKCDICLNDIKMENILYKHDKTKS